MVLTRLFTRPTCSRVLHTHLNPHLFFYAAWLTFSDNKSFGEENMLLKFNASSLSVSVRMSFELGNQSHYLGTSCLPIAVGLWFTQQGTESIDKDTPVCGIE